jgi:hypothetical protein
MTALSAKKDNPVIRSLAARPLAKGKPPSVVLRACMRKLLVIILHADSNGSRFGLPAAGIGMPPPVQHDNRPEITDWLSAGREAATVSSSPFIDPTSLLQPRRRIRGMSAILLPFRPDRSIDWDAFAAHIARTRAAGSSR